MKPLPPRMVTRTPAGVPEGILFCSTRAAIDAWVARLTKVGCNRFIVFQDVRGPALQFLVDPGVRRGCVSIMR